MRLARVQAMVNIQAPQKLSDTKLDRLLWVLMSRDLLTADERKWILEGDS